LGVLTVVVALLHGGLRYIKMAQTGSGREGGWTAASWGKMGNLTLSRCKQQDASYEWRTK